MGGKLYISVYNNSNIHYHRHITEAGKTIISKEKYRPSLFTAIHDGSQSEYRDINGNPVLKSTFKSISEATQAKSKNKSFIGMDNFDIAFLSDSYPEPITDFYDKLNIINFDIEVYSPTEFPDPKDANHPINSICIENKRSKSVYIVTTLDWKQADTIHPDSDIHYYHCKDEKELLKKLIKLWVKLDIHVLTGWHIKGFDIPYLVNRIEKIYPGKSSYLSPCRVIEADAYNEGEYKIATLPILDYIELYKKFRFITRPSYKLDYICEVEIGERKVDYDGNLALLADTDSQKFVDYNIQDVLLVSRLDDKLNLLRLALAMAYDAKINIEDVFYQTRLWDSIIFNHIRNQKIVVPRKKHTESVPYEGGYVKTPQVGYHSWIVSVDFTSLYPSIMRQFNISPETKIKKESTPNIEDMLTRKHKFSDKYIYAANGVRYSRDKIGIIPEVTKIRFDQRKHHKNLMKQAKDRGDQKTAIMEDVFQLAKKIQINSLYGAMGTTSFRYYDVDNAEAVTLTGQFIIKWGEKYLNKYFNKLTGIEKDRVVAIDTDSLYFNLSDVVEKFIPTADKGTVVQGLDRLFSGKLSNVIDQLYSKLAEYTNCPNPCINLDREVIADTGFWTAKKRYAVNVWDNEGYTYETPQIKIMGLETQRSSTPKAVQVALKDCIRLILTEDEQALKNYVNEFKTKFQNLPYQEISQISSANNLKKYIKKSYNFLTQKTKFTTLKGTPYHIKAVCTHNMLADKLDLEPINNGDKIAYFPLKTPNIYQGESFAYPSGGNIPKELEPIVQFIDREAIYEKTFLKPLNTIIDSIKWSIKNKRENLLKVG